MNRPVRTRKGDICMMKKHEPQDKTYKEKHQLENIASEVINLLREKDLIIWQAEEVLSIAKNKIRWSKLS